MTASEVLGLVGVTREEASARLAADGPNELPSAKERNLLQQAWEVLREPMLLLLVLAGTVNFLLAEVLDGVILLVSVVVVVGISIIQQHRTEHALAALRDLSAPRALVVRDGHQLRIPGRDVVVGDVVLLAEGDRVPADAMLIDAVNLSVDESALSGESVPVTKSATTVDGGGEVGRPGGDASPSLFSGTLVVRGRGVAVVRRTGAATELGRIGTALRTIESGPTPLQREIRRFVTVFATVGLCAAAAVVVIYGFTRDRWLEALLAGIGTAMSLLPEEFAVVFTVFLALGAWRMSQRHVLTRRSAVIETLGSATVLCVDKTGTLTLNDMVVSELVVAGERLRLGDDALPQRFHRLVEFAALASQVDPFDPVDRACRAVGDRYLSGTDRQHHAWELVREYPLSDDLLALSHVWTAPESGGHVVAAKGAPEAIADMCRLDELRRAAITAQVEAAAAAGLRVLGVARARLDGGHTLPDRQEGFGDAFELLGLVALHDPVRPGVPEAVAECRAAGVRVVMITGDYPATALAIAAEAGLEVRGGCITGPELAEMTESELTERIRRVGVFARMVPEQKLALVRALQANGEIVGMTGDGVNDAPALRAADIGIAMGERGTDVAREAADLVITDDDFGSIVGGVRRGRGIYDNLRKAMAYIIAVHVTIFGAALVPVFGPDWPLVLLPVQLALLELVIDPACSIVFESEQIDPELMRQSPRPVGAPMFGRRTLALAVQQGLWVVAAVLAVFGWAVQGGRSADEVRSVTFATIVIGNLALILVNRSWRLSVVAALRERRNATLKWILGLTGAFLVVLLRVPPLRDAFGFGPMRALDWLVAVAAGTAGVAWFELYKRSRRARPFLSPDRGDVAAVR